MMMTLLMQKFGYLSATEKNRAFAIYSQHICNNSTIDTYTVNQMMNRYERQFRTWEKENPKHTIDGFAYGVEKELCAEPDRDDEQYLNCAVQSVVRSVQYILERILGAIDK